MLLILALLVRKLDIILLKKKEKKSRYYDKGKVCQGFENNGEFIFLIINKGEIGIKY